MSFVITTDTSCDMPRKFYEENRIGVMTLSCLLEGETYTYDHQLPEKKFYEMVRNGSMPVTSQVNPENAREILEPYVQEGKDILHVGFSSGLSGSYNSARIAANQLMEEYPGTKIIVIDTLCASMGQGLILYKAVQMRDKGKTIEETAEWMEENKLHVCHNFTVDSLNHLYRGGRVSKATAVLGTMVGVKPVLHVDDEGKLVSLTNVRGRKKSLKALVDLMEKQVADYGETNEIVFISHGDCAEDAQYVADMIRERLGIKNFMINYIGPVIGTHAGPGTIALFFMGQYR